MLYIRMFITMGIALYTSRVVLNQLGIVDYGVFNVVGGIVSMMAFLNASMSLATQRYYAYDIGRQDNIQLRRTFSTSVNVHVIIALISILLAETVGLYVFWNYLDIPLPTRPAALLVYHLAIIQMALSIITVPFSSLTVAHEKMSAFAYISIFESLLKLCVAFLLILIPSDKLTLYACLLLISTAIITLTWIIYDFVSYQHCRYMLVWDRSIFRKLMSFTGWQTVGSLTWLLRTQGINVVLNYFFGPVLNAARGIAVQVNSCVMQFVSNFQMASNPQITKSYAVGDFSEMNKLIMRSSKISFLLMFILSLPLIIETEIVLRIWLKIIPEYGVVFVRLMLISTLFDLMSGTLVYGAFATGEIKRYQLSISSILIFEIILTVIAYRTGFPPQIVFYIEMFLYAVALSVRLYLLNKMVGLSIRKFLTEVLIPELSVVVVSTIISLLIYYLIPKSDIASLGIIVISFLIASTIAFRLGLTINERNWIKHIIKTKLKIAS